LREWASKELKGYDSQDELPAYRVVAATIRIDAIAGFTHISGQRMALHELPDFVQDKIGEHVELRDGIGMVEALISQAEGSGSSAKFSLPRAADLAVLMDHEAGDPYQKILDLYWSISTAALRAVVDYVKTALAELLAEMRAGTPDHTSLPPADIADQAVQVAIYGHKARVAINAPVASSGGVSTVLTNSSSDDPSWWQRWRRPGAFLVGFATVIGCVIAAVVYIQSR
jgi:hypothetical protein